MLELTLFNFVLHALEDFSGNVFEIFIGLGFSDINVILLLALLLKAKMILIELLDEVLLQLRELLLEVILLLGTDSYGKVVRSIGNIR